MGVNTVVRGTRVKSDAKNAKAKVLRPGRGAEIRIKEGGRLLMAFFFRSIFRRR